MPAYVPDSAITGSDPMNIGVRTIRSPSTKPLTIRWWPSICQPHGSVSEGVPNRLIQYIHSPSSSQPPLSSAMVWFSRITSRAVW